MIVLGLIGSLTGLEPASHHLRGWIFSQAVGLEAAANSFPDLPTMDRDAGIGLGSQPHAIAALDSLADVRVIKVTAGLDWVFPPGTLASELRPSARA
jgi:hypothetical protein